MAAGTQPVVREDRNGITLRLLLKTVLFIKDSFWVEDIHHIISLPLSRQLILLETHQRLDPTHEGFLSLS